MKIYQIMPVAAEGYDGLSFHEIMGEECQRLHRTEQDAEQAAEQSYAYDVEQGLGICIGYAVEEREVAESEIRAAAATYGWHQIGDVAGRTHSTECERLLGLVQG